MATATAIPLEHFKKFILPPLIKAAKGDRDALIKSVKLTLKQGDEGTEIPVVNDQGEPVPVTEVILVGAPAEDEPVEEAPTEEVTASLERMVDEILTKKLGDHGRPNGKSIHQPQPTKTVIPAQAKKWGGTRLKCFRGKDSNGVPGDERAYGFGQFISWVASKGANTKAAEWLKTNGIITQKVMTEGINSAGGALVPDQFSSDLIRLVEEYGVFRQEARVVPMTSDTLIVPRRTGGLTVTYAGEGVALTATDATLDNIQLTAKKATTITRISSELMEDAAISVGDLIGTEIALAFATSEDTVGFNGAGTSAHGGIFGITTKIDDGTHTASVHDFTSGDTSFGAMILNDFHSMVGLLPKFPGINPKWYISMPGFANAMQRLAHAQGGSTSVMLEEGSRLMFLGFPVVITQSLPTATGATVSDVMLLFGDLSFSSTFGDRRSLSIATSTERYFDSDETAIRGIERFDINNHDLGDNTNAGPIIAGKTPAS